MASISKRVFKQADQAEVAVLKAEHETMVSAELAKALSGGYIKQSADGRYYTDATCTPPVGLDRNYKPKPESIHNVLEELETLKPWVSGDLKESLLVKIIDETKVLGMALSHHCEGGMGHVPIDTTEEFMDWVFKVELPLLLDLKTDLTPSDKVVAQLKPAFAVWLTKFNTYLAFDGEEDEEDSLQQDFFNEMDDDTYYYYMTELAGYSKDGADREILISEFADRPELLKRIGA